MFLSKVLHKPHLVGVIMIVLLFGAGFIYAFAFDGFNIEKVTGSEVEAWLASTGGSGSGGSDTPDDGSDTPDDGSDTPDDGGDTPDDGGDTPDDGGDTPDDDTPRDGDEGGPCDCSATSDPYGECNCGNQTFNITKTDKEGSWKNPCGGVVDPYPCPSKDGCRNSHSSTGNSDCSCPPYPGHNPSDPNTSPRQKLWTVCKTTGKTKCNGKKGVCKKQKKQ